MRDRKSGHLMFRARTTDDATALVATNASGDDAPEGVWVHFAVVGEYDAVGDSYRITLYRNGIEAGGRDKVRLATLPLPLSFGGLENGWGFRGLLYDAQIYRRALRNDEIRFLVEHPGELPTGRSSASATIDGKP